MLRDTAAIALGVTTLKNATFLMTSFTLLFIPGSGNSAAQVQPDQQQLLGVLLLLTYEPQQQLEFSMG